MKTSNKQKELLKISNQKELQKSNHTHTQTTNPYIHIHTYTHSYIQINTYIHTHSSSHMQPLCYVTLFLGRHEPVFFSSR